MGMDVPRSGYIGYWICVAAPVTRDHIVTRSYKDMLAMSIVLERSRVREEAVTYTPLRET